MNATVINDTTSHNDTIKENAHIDFKLITVSLSMLLIIVVIVAGNTLVIVSVVSTRRLRTVTNYFVTSLAVADLLVGLCVMPPAIIVHINGTWELGWILCDIWLSLDILLCTASILSLCAISIDRCLAVTRPLSYSRRRRSKKLALGMIVAVWVLAAAITCPPMFGWYEPEHNTAGDCRYNSNLGYVMFSAISSFFVPMIVMVYVYGRIICVVARRHLQLSDNGGSSRCNTVRRQDSDSGSERASYNEKTKIFRGEPSTSNTKNPQELLSDSPFAKRCKSSRNSRVSSLKRETKTAQTLSIVVGGFIICWLPFFTYYSLTPFLKNRNAVLMNSFTWLGWVNSAMNPFIYAFYSPEFRLAFIRLTVSKFKRNEDNV